MNGLFCMRGWKWVARPKTIFFTPHITFSLDVSRIQLWFLLHLHNSPFFPLFLSLISSRSLQEFTAKDIRWKAEALLAMQEAAEYYLVGLFEDAWVFFLFFCVPPTHTYFFSTPPSAFSLACTERGRSFEKFCFYLSQCIPRMCAKLCWHDLGIYRAHIQARISNSFFFYFLSFLLSLPFVSPPLYSNLCAIHAKRVTIQVKDIQLARRIRGLGDITG